MTESTTRTLLRRTFGQLLAASLAAVAGIAVSPAWQSSGLAAPATLTVGSAANDFDVIVVGAGVAGLAAGQKLKERGLRGEFMGFPQECR